MQKKYKRLSVEFPIEDYVNLKMACAKLGVSLKDFVTNAVITSVKNYESKSAAKALKESTIQENLRGCLQIESR